MSGETPRATTVFVSYSRGDRKRALPVIQLLEAAGHSVWWDGKLEAGERFADTTAHALDTARAVVVLWSQTSITSHWVHDEATSGRDRRCLVPLSLDGSEAPLGFRQFQVIDISHARIRRGDPVAESVLRAVAALHDAGAGPAADRARPQNRSIDRRWLMLGGGAAAVVGATGAALLWRGRQEAATTAPATGPGAAASVAVLPFANLSNDPQQAYFSDGLAAEVRAELARNPRLLVAAQASSNRFRARAEDARTMAGQLGVAWLLDGSVRRAGDKVRIAAELIDGNTGFSKWTEQFERPISDVFAVQDDIAGAVAAALDARLAGGSGGDANMAGSSARPVGGTSNVAAYDEYLRGRALYALARDEASDAQALARFDAAVQIDPQYGAAHAARAIVLVALGNLYAGAEIRTARYEAAIAAAQRAVALSPQLADAHSALGFALFNGRLDARAARGPYDRAAALGQGDGGVLNRFAQYCRSAGRFAEARTANARARTLDPLNAQVWRVAGEIEYAARNYAGTLAPIQRALSLNRDMTVAHSIIGFARLAQNDLPAALAEFAAEPSAPFRLTGQAIVQYRLGQQQSAQSVTQIGAARAAFAQLVAELGDAALYQQAQVLAQWNDVPRALATLQRARATGDAGLIYARNDPLLDGLRSTRAFSDLLTTLGFD